MTVYVGGVGDRERLKGYEGFLVVLLSVLVIQEETIARYRVED